MVLKGSLSLYTLCIWISAVKLCCCPVAIYIIHMDQCCEVMLLVSAVQGGITVKFVGCKVESGLMYKRSSAENRDK